MTKLEKLIEVLRGDVRGVFTYVERVEEVDVVRQIRPQDVLEAIASGAVVSRHLIGENRRKS